MAIDLPIGQAQPSDRLRSTDMVQQLPYGSSQSLANDLFFGLDEIRTGILVQSPAETILLAAPPITLFTMPLGKTLPLLKIGTILSSPSALLTMPLSISRPRDFLPPSTGGGGNVGYAG